MSRHKKGRPLNGWVIVDKPLEMTSTQIVGKVRWAFGAQKAGHAGTLDPKASGVLAVALGEATKTIPYAQDGLKTYHFTVRWGAATTTDDLEGDIIETSDLRPGRAEIESLLPRMTGEIMQTPPIFSAIKLAGKRAYDLARAGEEVTLSPRPIWVESLKLLGMPDSDHAEFEMICGKGGYVRSMGRDLGQILGCFAHITALRRNKAGPFCLNQAITLEKLEELRHMDGAETHLLPVSTGLDDIPACAVTDSEKALLQQGRAIPVLGMTLDEGAVLWAVCNGQPVAIGDFIQGHMEPRRVFNL